MAAADALGAERAHRGGQQERAVGAAAVGDQHRAELAQPLLEGEGPLVKAFLDVHLRAHPPSLGPGPLLFLRGCCQHDNVGFVRLDRWCGSAGRWLVGCSAVLALVALPHAPAGASASPETQPPGLTLVTLTGPGTAGAGDRSSAADLLARQDALLSRIGGADPVYRWTTALNGFAVELTPAQRATLAADPQVSLVEANEVRPLASTSAASVERALSPAPRMRGGAGVVIGVIDTGIDAESPVFAAVPGLGRDPRAFRGVCRSGEGWSSGSCNRKLVAAQWFVEGFGAARIRSSEVLSARDTLGHGTQVASVAAGNARVSVRVDGRDAGQFGGVAPQARVAAYKACWGAPDPADDGCATADVVTAVDQAVHDGVDVLNLAIAGGTGIDTVQRALLGAAEADIVAVGAAGNNSRDSYAAHPAPWVTTVGSTIGKLARGTLRIVGGPALVGGAGSTTWRARSSGREPRRGASRPAARLCLPGSLDARKVAGRVVVCDRGGTARVAKSEAVGRQTASGWSSSTSRPGGVSADFHEVPTVHLSVDDGRTLRRWLRTHETTRVRLLRSPGASDVRRPPSWSAAGDPRGPVLKPDLVAPAESVLGAMPDSTDESWGVFSGQLGRRGPRRGDGRGAPLPPRLVRVDGPLRDVLRDQARAQQLGVRPWRRNPQGRARHLPPRARGLAPGMAACTRVRQLEAAQRPLADAARRARYDAGRSPTSAPGRSTSR